MGIRVTFYLKFATSGTRWSGVWASPFGSPRIHAAIERGR
jgi:hypothetical protein